MDKNLVDYLLGFITENKRKKFDLVLSQRTRHITVVMEDIYQAHNVSAVVRSCDCFGVQDIHIIENENRYKINPDVTLGATKWVDVYRYNQKEHNTIACINGLKKKGYKIWATSPHNEDINLEDLPWDSKVAFLFGRERDGLSQEALSLADGFVKVPMFGFTESLNISVCAAIILHHLSLKIRNSDVSWQLTEKEQMELKYQWLRKVLAKIELLEKEYLKKKGTIADVDEA